MATIFVEGNEGEKFLNIINIKVMMMSIFTETTR